MYGKAAAMHRQGLLTRGFEQRVQPHEPANFLLHLGQLLSHDVRTTSIETVTQEGKNPMRVAQIDSRKRCSIRVPADENGTWQERLARAVLISVLRKQEVTRFRPVPEGDRLCAAAQPVQ